jgi:type IX secretion system PorP/SprF family membrane protein
MKKIIITLFGCLFYMASQAQQDPQYSLYQFNQMAINPAYAGARDAVAVVIDARKQWVSFPGAPTTLGFTVHSPLANNKIGLGLNVVSDQIGAKSVTGAYGNFAYILKLNNKFKLSFGLRAGYLNYKFNFSKVNYKDANETTITDLANTNKGTLDLDAGLFLKSNSFFMGLSASHLNRAKIYSADYTSLTSNGTTQNYTANYVLNTHLFFIIGKAFAFNENFVFSPSIMVRSVSAQRSADVNLNFLIKQRIWLGVYSRLGYGAGALIQVYATDKLRIGYSYDTGLGSQRLLGSSHEIMIGFDFGKYKSKTLSPRFL